MEDIRTIHSSAVSMKRKKTNKSRTPLIVGLALTAVTLAVFSQVWNFDFIIYDDPAYVTANPQVKAGLSAKNFVWALTTSHTHNWHPLTWLSLMLDCSLFGPDPGWLHLTNLLLHTANTILLFVVLFRMTKALWPSAFVAAVFALHPLHIQSVAWIAERKDVLSTLFWLLTMLFYIRYAEQPRPGRYLLTLVVFALGLMAKPMLVSLPFILLLLDYWPLNRFGNSKRSILNLLLEKIPLVVLSAVSCVITFIIQQQSGAVKGVVQFPFAVRIANALVSYVQYLAKMFWPADLSVFYPHPGRLLHPSEAMFCALLLVAVTVLAIRLARTHGYLFVGWAWYIGTLIPVIGLVQVGEQAMADRYTYVPLIGLFIIIGWGLPDLLAGYAFRETLLSIAAAVVLLAMAGSTYLQLCYWQNSVTIFEHAVEATPNNRFAHANLGAELLLQNKLDHAIEHFEKVLIIDPLDAMSHLNIGVALFRIGRTDEAVSHFNEALRIEPEFVEAHVNLGIALTKQGRTQQAIEHYTEALRIDPSCTNAFDLRNRMLQQTRQ